MRGRVEPTPGRRLAGRLGSCALAITLGGLAAVVLLAAVAQSAWAATAQSHTYPGSAPCDTTLQACLDGVAVGDTVVVQPGTYITSVTLSRAVSLTGVNSATVILQALPSQRVLTATGATVDSSVVISGLTFTGGSEMGFLGAGGGLVLINGAQPRLDNIRVINNQASFLGGGIFGQAVRLSNSLVQSNTAAFFGGGVMTFLDAAISGSRFEANTCTLDGCMGGGLYAGTAALTGTSFVSNTARTHGGGLMAATAVTLAGGLFQQNACTQTGCIGGGLMTSGTLAATGAIFTGNVAVFGGGGAWVEATAALTGVQMRSNASTDLVCWGGALFSNLTTTVQGGQFTGNSCRGGGGAFYVGWLVLTDALVMSNTVGTVGDGGSGGGARVGFTATLSGGQFIGNFAADGGGGLSADSLIATGTQFINNSAPRGGGANASSAQITGALFQANTAEFYGGGLYATQLTMTDSVVLSNTAEGSGGGVRVGGSAALSGGLFQGNLSLAAYGGGIYFGAGGSRLDATGVQFIANQAALGSGGAGGMEQAHITSTLFLANACLLDGCPGGGLNGFSVFLVDSDFISNTARGSGGGSLAYGTWVEGGLFERNACLNAGCNGGGVWSNIGLHLLGTTVISNTAQGHGGGAYGDNNINLTDAVFQGNQAAQAGGGAYSFDNATVSGTDFFSNTAGTGGGALRSVDTTLSGSRLQGNSCAQAGCAGGGLWVADIFNVPGTLSVVNSEFHQNTSLGGGGGVSVSGTATFSGSLLAGNTCAEAGCQGGALRAASGLAVTATQFLGNHAGGMGGGLAHQSGDGAVVNALFARNSAGTAGAALYLASGGAVNVLHTTIASPTLGAGAAIDVVSGTVQVIDTLVATYSVGLRRLSLGSLYEDYNLFFGVSSPKVGVMTGGTNDTGGDPRFNNPAADDYHLRRGSAAIDAGADFAITTDFDGEARPHGPGFDIGYDEAVEKRVYVPLLLR